MSDHPSKNEKGANPEKDTASEKVSRKRRFSDFQSDHGIKSGAPNVGKTIKRNRLNAPAEDNCASLSEKISEMSITANKMIKQIKSKLPLELSKMKIFVKTLYFGKTITIEVEPTDTIKDIKSKFKEKEGLPKAKVNFRWAGKLL